MSKIFEKYLGKHLNVEMRKDPIYRSLKINESHGAVDFIDTYKNMIFYYMYENFPIDFGSETVYEFNTIIDIYNNPELNKARREYIKAKKQGVFDKNLPKAPFFRYINLYIKTTLSSEEMSSGGYSPEESEYEDDCEGTVSISITVYCHSMDHALCMIDRNIEHEFIHALEDCERRKYTGHSLADKIKRDNYERYFDVLDNNDYYMNCISILLYNTYDSEINAQMGGLNADLKKNKDLVVKKYDDDSLMELIKSTKAYKIIDTCQDNIDALSHVSSQSIKDKLLKYANRLRINDDVDPDERLEPFMTYGDMMRYFKKQLYKMKKRMANRGMKMAYRVFNEYGFYAHWDRHPSAEMMNEMFGKYNRKFGKMKEERKDN